MRQNTFDGRAPPGPAGGAYALPQTPSRNEGPTSKGGRVNRGREGQEGREEKGKREGRGSFV